MEAVSPPSNRSAAPGLALFPGFTNADQRSPPSFSTSNNSTAGSFDQMRAGMTLVSLSTSRSPARR